MLKFFTLLTILGWAATLAYVIYFVVRKRQKAKELSDDRGFEVVPLDKDKKGTP